MVLATLFIERHFNPERSPMPNTQRLLPTATTRRLPAVQSHGTVDAIDESAGSRHLGPFVRSVGERLGVSMGEISRLWWKLYPLGEGRVAQVAPAFNQTLRAHRQLVAKLPALLVELKRAPTGERRDASCWGSMVNDLLRWVRPLTEQRRDVGYLQTVTWKMLTERDDDPRALEKVLARIYEVDLRVMDRLAERVRTLRGDDADLPLRQLSTTRLKALRARIDEAQIGLRIAIVPLCQISGWAKRCGPIEARLVRAAGALDLVIQRREARRPGWLVQTITDASSAYVKRARPRQESTY